MHRTIFLHLPQPKRYLCGAMRETRNHIGAQTLLALFVGLFWLTPNAHIWTVSHEAGEHVSCAPVSGCHAQASDASEADAETEHDPDTCSICRLAALPYALHIYPTPHGIRPYSAPEHTLPERTEFMAFRYEGFSFGARAPPPLHA